jgi:hypothetical protein
MFIEWTYKLSLFISKISFPEDRRQSASFVRLVTCYA